MSDLSKPNHYFNDNPGDPEPLTDDPRFSGLPASVVERAKQAKCTRCKAVCVEEKSIVGTVFVQYYIPALGVRQRGLLCGPCGLLLREFLAPEILDDPAYQAVITELRSRWA